MKTLYISDLDSTLLNSKAHLTDFTRDTLNALAEKGMLFSYATARSVNTASKVTEGLRGDVPVIVYTGTFIVENCTHKRVVSNFMTEDEINVVKAATKKFSVVPIVYSFLDSVERFMYDPQVVSKNVREFAKTREGDSRKLEVSGGFESALVGNIFYFTFMEPKEKLLPVYEFLKDKCNCLFQADNYTDNWFLEVMPSAATKANAALKLKELTGADRLVAFGDGVNDMELFIASDECYAVSNAVPELKAIATGVIGSCDEDAVAKWLLENFRE